MSEKTHISSKKKTAFVCSGGGVKAGAFHLGVALALHEHGFRFYGGTVSDQPAPTPPGPMSISTYVGSSAGSLIVSFLAAGYTLENIFNSFLSRKPQTPEDAYPKVLPKLTYSKIFKLRPELAREQMSQMLQIKNILPQLMRGDWEGLLEFQWLRTNGFFSTRGIEQYMRKEVLQTNSFQDYLADIFIVATQLNHSRKMVFGKYHYQPPPDDPSCQYVNNVAISDACAASAALPFIFAPYGVSVKAGNKDGTKTFFIDGEIRDTLSTHVAVDAGADLIFASYTHQPYHLNREIGSLTHLGLPSILIQSIYLVIEQKINSAIHAKRSAKNAILAVEKYCQQNGIDSSKTKRILEILESELGCRSDVDTLYIHPEPTDSQMFFQEHFNLTPIKMAEIVRSGFRAGINVLRRYEFADAKNSASSSSRQRQPEAAG